MGMKSIMNFFRPTEQRQPANADVSTLEAAKTNCKSSKSQPKVRKSATQNGSYITQTIQTDSQPNPNEISSLTLYQMPSIALIWSPAISAAPHPPKPQKMPVICKHLSGPDYDEYILRIQTRTLGGILMELWAAAIYNLFPYKNLPLPKDALLKTDRCALIWTSKPHLRASGSKVSQIPSDWNVEQKERVWTDAEKKKLDKFLTGWA